MNFKSNPLNSTTISITLLSIVTILFSLGIPIYTKDFSFFLELPIRILILILLLGFLIFINVTVIKSSLQTLRFTNKEIIIKTKSGKEQSISLDEIKKIEEGYAIDILKPINVKPQDVLPVEIDRKISRWSLRSINIYKYDKYPELSIIKDYYKKDWDKIKKLLKERTNLEIKSF